MMKFINCLLISITLCFTFQALSKKTNEQLIGRYAGDLFNHTYTQLEWEPGAKWSEVNRHYFNKYPLRVILGQPFLLICNTIHLPFSILGSPYWVRNRVELKSKSKVFAILLWAHMKVDKDNAKSILENLHQNPHLKMVDRPTLDYEEEMIFRNFKKNMETSVPRLLSKLSANHKDIAKFIVKIPDRKKLYTYKEIKAMLIKKFN